MFYTANALFSSDLCKFYMVVISDYLHFLTWRSFALELKCEKIKEARILILLV